MAGSADPHGPAAERRPASRRPSAPGLHPRLRLLSAAALLLSVAPALASTGIPPATLDDCDAPGIARTLVPVEQAPPPARAHWLDATTLRWPGAPVDGRYALHHGDGGLRFETGQPLRGGSGRIALKRAAAALPADLAQRFAFVADGATLRVPARDAAQVRDLLRGQLLLVREDAAGRALDATALQLAGALDDAYAAATDVDDLGATPAAHATGFRLWAPTARGVSLCLYRDGAGGADALLAMRRDDTTGAWSASPPGNLAGRYYAYLVDVFVPGTGLVRNRVTDPYSTSLGTDSRRSYVADLDAPDLKPGGWDTASRPAPLRAATDMAIYELHVRDFSVGDPSVPARQRGKYLAFTQRESDGMRHLRALAGAGLTDIHLLPVFDLASVPESGCATPEVPHAAADADAQQAAVMAQAARDCFNWGYDPLHFNAPEGSYASDAADGGVRIREFRSMVMALHAVGLRVGMDVVYNHTSASGQHPHSVLDRIVPGYYHRLEADGGVARSTCCDNTATEHAMMAKLMVDSAVLWARHYRIDSFRFDLMGHQPRAAMERLRDAVDAAAGREVQLIGEGWDFGEVAGGSRFVQAAQGSLAGARIATFSDRARDAIRGGGPADAGKALSADQGYGNGLHYDRNASAPERPAEDLLRAADLVRVGLAGTLGGYAFTTHDGRRTALRDIDYRGQPAGYASQPGEVVNYVENHDNQTLFDINAWKLPRGTGGADRARMQVLAMALNAFSQGIAYFHAGIDTLRSKSLDRNSYDSGDWFNRLDWSYRDNHFGTGLPPAADNGGDWARMRPLLADPSIKPSPADIAFARDAFRDLLRIRASSTLFRLDSAEEVQRRLSFPNTGPAQDAQVMAGRLDGRGLAGAGFDGILYFVNVGSEARQLVLPEEAGQAWVLHPVHLADGAADPRPRAQAHFDPASGRFTLPARTAVVYVAQAQP